MSITLKNINDLTTGVAQANDRLVFGRIGETELFKINVQDLFNEFGSGVSDLSYQVISIPILLEDPLQGQSLGLTINNQAGQVTFVRYNVLVNGSLGRDTYLVKRGEGVHTGLTYGDLLRVDRVQADLTNVTNTVTYTINSLDDINNPYQDLIADYIDRVDADSGEVFLSNFQIATRLSNLLGNPLLFDFSDSEIVYFVSIASDLYQFTGVNGFYGLGGLELTFNDLTLLTGSVEVDFDNQLDETSSNGVENRVITKEFLRTNFGGFDLSTSIFSASELDELNYRFVNKVNINVVSVSVSADVSKDFNTFGYVQEGAIQFFPENQDVELISPNGQTITSNEAFHLCRVSATKFVLIKFADSASAPTLQQVLTQGNSTDLPINFLDNIGNNLYSLRVNSSTGDLEVFNNNTNTVTASFSDDGFLQVYSNNFAGIFEPTDYTQNRSIRFRDASGFVTFDPTNDLASVRVNQNEWRHQHVTESIVITSNYEVLDKDYDVIALASKVVLKLPSANNAQNRELRLIAGEGSEITPTENIHKITATNSVVYDTDTNNNNIVGKNNKFKVVKIKSIFWSGSWKWTLLQNESIPN